MYGTKKRILIVRTGRVDTRCHRHESHVCITYDAVRGYTLTVVRFTGKRGSSDL